MMPSASASYACCTSNASSRETLSESGAVCRSAGRAEVSSVAPAAGVWVTKTCEKVRNSHLSHPCADLDSWWPNGVVFSPQPTSALLDYQRPNRRQTLDPGTAHLLLAP